MTRLKNILIGSSTLLFSLWRGNAKKQGKVKRVAILYPTNNIGDMVCATPLFRALKQYDSTIHVTVIGSPKNRELLAGNTDVDEYIVDTMSWWTLARLLKKRHIDAGIVISSSVQNLATLFFAGVKNVSCFALTGEYKSLEARPYRMVSWLAHRVPYFPGEYVPDQYLHLLRPFGIEAVDVSKHLVSSLQSRDFVLQKFSEQGFQNVKNVVAIAPGAGALYKQWPPERFAHIANYIYATYGSSIVLVGSRDDARAVEGVIKNLNKGITYWSPGPMTLDALKGVLACSCLVIGNDSGAIHVGEALGRATLTVAGPTDVSEHMRSDELHRVVCALTEGTPLYRAYVVDETTIDAVAARAQMEAVTVEEVCKEIESLMQRISAKVNI